MATERGDAGGEGTEKEETAAEERLQGLGKAAAVPHMWMAWLSSASSAAGTKRTRHTDSEATVAPATWGNKKRPRPLLCQQVLVVSLTTLSEVPPADDFDLWSSGE